MSYQLRLASLLAAIAFPALAQAPSTGTVTTPARPPVTMPATPATPATPTMPAMPRATTAAPAPATPAQTAPATATATPARPTTAAPAAAPAAAATAAAPAATPAARPASAGKVDINSATEAQLDSLFGIGPVRAKAIVAGRPYADLRDLVRKKILTQGVFAKAKDGMALASLNSSTAAQLEATLPGIGDVRSKAIVAARPYAAPQDLVAKGVLTQAQFNKIAPLVAL